MASIYHFWGQDLELSLTGDLESATQITESDQAVLRRLLTNPGEYIFHPDYGAGLPRYVGEDLSSERYNELVALVTGQMQLEDTVAQTPPPDVTFQADTAAGILYCTIRYTWAQTGERRTLSFSVR
jgi:phage baseplate assembly protein W